MMFLRRRRQPVNAPPLSGLLDGLPVPMIACGVNYMLSSYAGPCLRVRRENDSALQDIAFTRGCLDTTALLNHCGSNGGRIVTLYDQSPNARHLTQSVAGSEFYITWAGSYLQQLEANALQVRSAAFTTFPAVLTGPMTIVMGLETVTPGGTDFGRLLNIGTAGGSRLMVATQGSAGNNRLLVQRPAVGVEHLPTPNQTLPSPQVVLAMDKPSGGNLNLMRSWVNGGTASTWNTNYPITDNNGDFTLGSPASGTGTGFGFYGIAVWNVQLSDAERQQAIQAFASMNGAIIS